MLTVSHNGKDDEKCGISYQHCRTLSHTLKAIAKDGDIIAINEPDNSQPFPMKMQRLVQTNITLIGITGKARIEGENPVVDNYLFNDKAGDSYTSRRQVTINIVNLELIRIGIIAVKNRALTLNLQLDNCTVSNLSSSSIVDSSAARTTVVIKTSTIDHVLRALELNSRVIDLRIDSSKIINSAKPHTKQGCPQFIVSREFTLFVAHVSKSLYKRVFLIDLEVSHEGASNISITDSAFEDDNNNFNHSGCSSGMSFKYTTALIANSNFTNIVTRKPLIKTYASSVSFKNCIFNRISVSDILSYGAVYLQSTDSVFQNCVFQHNTINAFSGNKVSIVAVESSHLLIQKSMFKNTEAAGHGGAIYITKSRSLFDDCTFERNVVKNVKSRKMDTIEGVIYVFNSSHIRMKRCYFIGNEAFNKGGALSVWKTESLILENCTFTNNTVYGTNSGGGAMFIAETQSLFEGCFFERNTASGPQRATCGGAIYAFSNSQLRMKQCFFRGNKATYEGGALCVWRAESLTFENCIFENNSVYGLDSEGGAVFVMNSRSLFQSCTFERNTANGIQTATYGGAINALSNSLLSVKQCLFKGNKASYGGGAFRILKAESLIVENCTFENNSVYGPRSAGGAMFIMSTRSLFQSCTFESNTRNGKQTVTYGGAIYAFKNSHLKMKQCLFKGNKATYEGGAFCISKTESLILENCTFENNSVYGPGSEGGAVFIMNTPSLLQSCTFERNTANDTQTVTYGGAIYTFKTSHLRMKQCLFKENKATYEGGAFFISKTESLIIENCTFENNIVYGPRSAGGAMFIMSTRSLFQSCTFESNTANGKQTVTYGGAIFAINTSSLKMNLCLFKGNKATHMGGAFYMEKTQRLILENCTFKTNTVYDPRSAGGAMSITRARSSFEKCTFERNTAVNQQSPTFGGAIYAFNKSNLNINRCFFIQNEATYYGGAIYIFDVQSLFENCTFERNIMKGVKSLKNVTFGGAILAYTSQLKIKQCFFGGNRVTFGGGAIYVRNTSSLIENSTFSGKLTNV